MKEIYEILDNGGVTFKCEVLRKENKINVYKAIYDEDFWENYRVEYKYIFSRYYEKIFIGEDPYDFSGQGYNEDFIGNSILIKMLNGKYMFIGEVIYEFSISNIGNTGVKNTLITEDDEIVEFYSYVGSSGVPYPFAIGKKYSYLFIFEYGNVAINTPGSKIPRTKIPNKFLNLNFKVTKDLYMQYFDIKRELKLPFEVRIVHKRLGD